MIKTNKLNVGDSSENGQITIIDEDRLCYLVKSDSKGAVGLRTISKALLQEFVTFMEQHPEVPTTDIRFKISGQSDIDKYEYGYGATLVTMAKMILGQEKILRSAKRANRFHLSPLQRIFYGAPGTGKSYAIKKLTEGKNVIRTTFHPDSDYSTFVGAYKPTTKQVPVFSTYGEKAVAVKGADGQQITEDRIIYEFVDQAFLQAYTNAWKLYAQAVKEGKQPAEQYLIIEEINRGNCAQIFGDLFQLLDRDEEGFSEYPIKADKDIKKYLDSVFNNMVFLNAPALCGMNSEETAIKIRKGEILVLPSNLYIWATMNTSDQSLFPIDSAFKRRWDWQYVPIFDAKKNWTIEANGNRYDWWSFLEKINERIGATTNSEDKKLGYFFCKADENGIISAEKFVNKVIFYLWNDVFKDYGFEDDIFKDENGDKLSFNNFYYVDEDRETKVQEDKVEIFLNKLGLTPIIVVESNHDSDDSIIQKDNNSNQLKVELDGKIFQEKNAIDTFAKIIEYIGPEKIVPLEITIGGHKLLSLTKIAQDVPGGYGLNIKNINGYWMLTKYDNLTKKKWLNKIATELNLNLKIIPV